MMRLTIQIFAVFLLGFGSPAMARLSSVDLYPKNLQKYGFTVNSSNADGMVRFNLIFIPKPGQRQVEDLDFRGKLTLKTKGKLVAEVMLDVIRREESVLYHFSFSEDLIDESIFSVIIAPKKSGHMATTYILNIRDFLSNKKVSEKFPCEFNALDVAIGF